MKCRWKNTTVYTDVPGKKAREAGGRKVGWRNTAEGHQWSLWRYFNRDYYLSNLWNSHSYYHEFQSENLVIKLPQKSRLEVTRVWPRQAEKKAKKRETGTMWLKATSLMSLILASSLFLMDFCSTEMNLQLQDL